MVKAAIGRFPELDIVARLGLGQRRRGGLEIGRAEPGKPRRSARTSSAARIAVTSSTRPGSSGATRTPRRGSLTRRPCASSVRKASRTGTWLAPNSAATWSWRTAAPGASAPMRMRCARLLAMRPVREPASPSS